MLVRVQVVKRLLRGCTKNSALFLDGQRAARLAMDDDELSGEKTEKIIIEGLMNARHFPSVRVMDALSHGLARAQQCPLRS